MKLAIIGSRNIINIDLSIYVPDEVNIIISGGAKGVDELAEQYADKKRLSKFIIRPNYKRYKKGATIVRNKEIVEISDAVLVFWNGYSKGTKSTIEYAEKIGKPITIIKIEEEKQTDC